MESLHELLNHPIESSSESKELEAVLQRLNTDFVPFIRNKPNKAVLELFTLPLNNEHASKVSRLVHKLSQLAACDQWPTCKVLAMQLLHELCTVADLRHALRSEGSAMPVVVMEAFLEGNLPPSQVGLLEMIPWEEMNDARLHRRVASLVLMASDSASPAWLFLAKNEAIRRILSREASSLARRLASTFLHQDLDLRGMIAAFTLLLLLCENCQMVPMHVCPSHPLRMLIKSDSFLDRRLTIEFLRGSLQNPTTTLRMLYWLESGLLKRLLQLVSSHNLIFLCDILETIVEVLEHLPAGPLSFSLDSEDPFWRHLLRSMNGFGVESALALRIAKQLIRLAIVSNEIIMTIEEETRQILQSPNILLSYDFLPTISSRSFDPLFEIIDTSLLGHLPCTTSPSPQVQQDGWRTSYLHFKMGLASFSSSKEDNCLLRCALRLLASCPYECIRMAVLQDLQKHYYGLFEWCAPASRPCRFASLAEVHPMGHANMQDELEASRREIDKLQEEGTALQGALSTAQAKIVHLEDDLHRLTLHNQQLTMQCGTQESELCKREDHLQALLKECQELQITNENLERTRKDQLANLHQNYSNRMETLLREKEHLQDDLARSHQQVIEVQAELSKALYRIEQSKTENDHVVINHLSHIARLEQTIKELRFKVKTDEIVATQRLAELETREKSLALEVERLRSQRAAWICEEERMTFELQDLHAKLDAKQMQLDQLHREIADIVNTDTLNADTLNATNPDPLHSDTPRLSSQETIQQRSLNLSSNDGLEDISTATNLLSDMLLVE